MARAALEVRRFNADRPACRTLEFRVVPLPAGTDPADLAAEGADGVRGRLDGSMTSRVPHPAALEGGELGSADGRDRLWGAAPAFAELADGFLYQELLQLVSDRLDSPPELLARMLPPRGRRPPAQLPER